MKTIIIIPVLNELEGLKTTLPLIKKEWYDRLVVLDGRSSDRTIEWCKEHNHEVFCQRGPGLWNAYTELFQYLNEEDGVVVTLSPDGNCPPELIPSLVTKVQSTYDLVIASRYLNGGRSEDDTTLTRFGNHLLTWMANQKCRTRYTDALNMYRAYRLKVVRQLGLDIKVNWLQRCLIRLSNLYSWEPSLSIRAGRIPLRITEISASEPKACRERRQNTFIHGLAVLTQIIHEGWFRR